MIWIELCILLACILIGARLGGIALGTVPGIGLAVFVFLFGLPPGSPPQIAIGMIIAVITALATLQAAGGLDYTVSIAEKILRRHPQYVTFLGPVITYILIVASGTTHVIYALLPVIAEVSRKAGIRPERHLSISVIAGFQGAVASPISAATVAMVGLLAGRNVSLPHLLAITIPSTFLAVLIGALSVAWRGKELSEDPEYQKRLADGALKPPAPAPARATTLPARHVLRTLRQLHCRIGGSVTLNLIRVRPSRPGVAHAYLPSSGTQRCSCATT
jgi:anaerobic C4-dicarboxylate transporter-like protein